jgi:integrase
MSTTLSEDELFKLKQRHLTQSQRALIAEDEISILSADETERLFRAADPAAIPFLTLSFFAGIRRATLERLDWSDVKFDEKRVIVPRHKGKNQLRYRVTLSENALEWLRPYLKTNGSLMVPATSINEPGAAFGTPSSPLPPTNNRSRGARRDHDS